MRKKDLAALYPRAKEFLFEFTATTRKSFGSIKDDLKRMENVDTASDVDSDDERVIAEALTEVLRQTQAGDGQATAYHRLMIGIVEFIFYPKLCHPKKEQEIHEGRKRIDIVMENSAPVEFSTLYRTSANCRVPTCLLNVRTMDERSEIQSLTNSRAGFL